MKGNKTLYFFQGIACILVVLIHIPFPGIVGIFFISLARYAVPFFFMISGFSLYKYIETPTFASKIKERIKRNFSITILALIVYFFIDIGKCIIKGEAISTFLLPLIAKENLLKLFIFGIIPPSSGGVIWFIIALIYVYIIKLILQPQKRYVYLHSVISLIIMIAASICKVYFTAYPTTTFGIDLSSYWLYGNWIFIGLPCINIGIGIGKVLEDYREQIDKVRSACWAIITVCAIINFGVCYYLERDLNMYLSYTLFTLIIDIAIFVISSKDIICETNILVWIGKYHSRNMYLWHHIFIFITNFTFAYLEFSESTVACYLQPVLVILLTLLFSIAIGFLSLKKKRVWQRISHRNVEEIV